MVIAFRINVCQLSPMKCGTTWLSSIIKDHPDVKVSSLDHSFIDYPDDFANRMGSGEEKKLLYARRNLSFTHNFSEALYKHNEQMKFIVLLRDPIDRLISHWKHHVIKMESLRLPIHPSVRVFKSMLTNEYEINTYLESSKVQRYSAAPFLSKGLYYSNLAPYLRLFNTSNFLVIQSEQLFSDTEETLRKILRFCGLETENFLKTLALENYESRNTHEDMKRSFARFKLTRKRIFHPLSEDSLISLRNIFNFEAYALERSLGYSIEWVSPEKLKTKNQKINLD